jgi:RNA polymerase sigma-70 factor (ECF subfamily)
MGSWDCRDIPYGSRGPGSRAAIGWGNASQNVELGSRPVGSNSESHSRAPTAWGEPEMSKVTEIGDDALLARMVAGDEEAFVLLYRRRHPAVYRYALHMSGNRGIAEDVTQEVFMALIRDARRFDPARGALGGFLIGIARNHLRKRWEQDRRLATWGDDEPETVEVAVEGSRYGGNGAGFASQHFAVRGAAAEPAGEFGDLSTAEAAERLRQAVAKLPGKYRETVVLCDLEEMSYEEAAVALGCPIGTVRSRLHRARAILLEKLREAPVRRTQAMR